MKKIKNKPNKIVAIMLMTIMAIFMLLSKDATWFVFSLIIGIPLFFAKQNWIN